ncbi:MAG TPA: MSHA biogenesis protein MshK [Burkholderiales bacterium]|nr:MSHA biogenesis protein MshK [Burkholderiales bacterium]
MAHGMKARAILAWFLLLASAAPAATPELLADPMRPPPEFRDAERAEATPPGQPLVLQSIRISSAQRTAVISGVTVRAGDRVGNATVGSISDGEVVLQQDGIEQVLRLYPAVEKRAADTERKPRPRAQGPAPRGGTP